MHFEEKEPSRALLERRKVAHVYHGLSEPDFKDGPVDDRFVSIDLNPEDFIFWADAERGELPDNFAVEQHPWYEYAETKIVRLPGVGRLRIQPRNRAAALALAAALLEAAEDVDRLQDYVGHGPDWLINGPGPNLRLDVGSPDHPAS
ncbi:hypothetical protein [Bauldia litoralis]|uniref:Uncharacterized protein n=1 Tax=Bauldia litoralis TaxID=665467 RepID=A0A1G6A5R0_9HYPH|nr:hypothetical protein [Bauldia litoralis]SDB03752.1 hypothetical protein SAMN02982931_00205 [Bauldia litoralis]